MQHFGSHSKPIIRESQHWQTNGSVSSQPEPYMIPNKYIHTDTYNVWSIHALFSWVVECISRIVRTEKSSQSSTYYTTHYTVRWMIGESRCVTLSRFCMRTALAHRTRKCRSQMPDEKLPSTFEANTSIQLLCSANVNAFEALSLCAWLDWVCEYFGGTIAVSMVFTIQSMKWTM